MSEDTNSQLPERIKNFLPLKSIFTFLFVFIVGVVIYLSNSSLTTRIEEYKESVYTKISNKVIEQFDMLLKERLNSASIIATSLVNSLQVKKALLEDKPHLIDFTSIMDEIDTKKEYLGLQMEVIKANGDSFVRSWTELSCDNLLDNDQDLQEYFRRPKVETSIISSKFGLTIATKIPVFYKSRLLGVFVLHLQLDSIVDMLAKDGFKSVILLSKYDSSKISQNLSYSHNFIQDKYVVNRNADKYLVKIIRDQGVNKFYCKIWKKNYKLEPLSGHLVSKYIIKNDNGSYKACIFIFKRLDEIEFPSIDDLEQSHITTSLLIIVFLAFIMTFVYSIVKIRVLDKENRALIIINEKLSMKTNEMDFKDKKLENLFNMQPNLMMMHNGKEITQANQRFMGFFNRFKTFAGFREHHKCVSELFEPYDAPNYISEAYIDGLFWIDYILKYPKRMYKVVISYKDSRMCSPHHFIIKLNEMEYAKKVDDRLVIIALVDMTQDLENYKTQEDRKLLETLKQKETEKNR